MPVIPPKYPTQVWDGLTPNSWRRSRNDHVDPDGKDWDQIAAEVISTQEHLDEITATAGITIKVSAYLDNNQVMLSGADYPILFNQELFDANNCFNTATGTFTAPRSGFYIIYGQTNFTSAFPATSLLYLRIGGVIRATFIHNQNYLGTLSMYTVQNLNAGDTVQLCAGQWSGSNKNLQGTRTNTYINILGIA